MSEQRDSEARGDDPLTCSKCGGPTKENGRWHPDIGAVYGYELGLAERDPASDTPEVAERPEKCPTCGGAPDDPGYDEINAGDQTGRDYCPDPFHTPEDTSRVEEDEPIDLTTPVRTRARLERIKFLLAHLHRDQPHPMAWAKPLLNPAAHPGGIDLDLLAMRLEADLRASGESS